MLFHVSTSFIIVPLLPSVSPSCAVSARYGSNEAAWPQKPRLSQFVNSGYYTSHRPLLPVQLREAPSTSPTASASNLWKNHGVSNRIMAANAESLPISMGCFPMDFPHLIFHGYLRWLHGLIRNFLFWCISCLMVFEICGDVLLKIISPGFCRLCTIMEYLEPVENRFIFCEEFRRIRDPLDYDRTQT